MLRLIYLFINQIAAFIAEPVMGAGGVIPPPATYFEKVSFRVKKEYYCELLVETIIYVLLIFRSKLY